MAHNEKQIIKPDYSELFKHIVEPDKSELIILASSHSTGKTSLAISLALEFARKYQKEVDYFSLELTTKQFVLRLLSIEASVDINRLKHNLLERDEIERLLYCIEHKHMNNIPLYIDYSSDGNLIFKKIRSRSNPGLIVVDYLQLLTEPDYDIHYGFNERYRMFSDKIRVFKHLVKELNIPVVLLSQVSRDINYQSVKRPSLKNIRKLFDIDEVDKIIFLYRDSLYNSNSENPDSIELNISKNNNGKLGSFDYRI